MKCDLLDLLFAVVVAVGDYVGVNFSFVFEVRWLLS